MSYALVGEFTVKAARNRGNIPNTNGPGELTRWYVDFVDANGEPVKDANGKVADAYWQRKPDAEVKAGDTVYGTITEGQYGLRFKMEKKPDGSYGGGSSGGGKREWKPEAQFDPEKTARIGRAHAQGMAVEVCKAMGVFEGNSAEQVYSKLQGWINWFESDVNQAGDKAANRAEGTTPPSQEGSAPPSDASPSSGSQRDEHQWFKRLLEAAAMDSEPAHVLAEFISTKFDPEQKVRAEAGLEDFNSQMDTLAKLKASYEQMEKKSLPSGKSEDDIPF